MTRRERPYSAAKVSLLGDRACNQDRCLFLDNGSSVLLGIADGLGGHPRGEVAAQLFIDACEAMFRRSERPLVDPERFMLQCIGKAHQSILRFGSRQQPPIAPRTTAVLAIVQNGVAHWAHVGDSRLYLIRDRQAICQTRDHSQLQFVRQSADQAPRARANLTRCLGGLWQPPTTTCGSPTGIEPGDTLLLCTDGLWGQIASKTLVSTLGEHHEPLEKRLTELAQQASGMTNSDNISAVAVQWHAPATSYQSMQ